MIIELPNFVSKDDVERIRSEVRSFLYRGKNYAYNRDGITVSITHTPELKSVDTLLSKIFATVQSDVIQPRFKPASQFGSGDSGYEYHVYRENDVCHYHADHEFSSTESETMLRYASVVLLLTDVPKGGELIFPSQEKNVKSEAGKVVIFPPYGMFGHYVTTPSVPREVIVTWFVYTGIKAVRT
jgi:predicted 2-oxoglutarate/Fe(II)-dependent dioxygenase YbiX